ncbi:MAG: ATP-grasp domain-containing protein [Proteobacteria bacterium]|nr:ATP-grasp domain-containing protein [Pseudomonadota bacterium]
MNVLVLNRWPQYPNSDRWDNSLARLDELLPATQFRVSYMCDQTGRQGLPAQADDIHIVDDFADHDQVVELAEHIQAERGRFDLVVAFSEFLLDVAGRIRQRCGIAGPGPDEVEWFRNKHIMKQRVEAAGLRVPRWFLCHSPEQVLSDARSLGFPLIFKPLRGAVSQGVHKVSNAAELAALCRSTALQGQEIEEYIEGRLMHTDGVVGRDGCIYMCTSRYIVPCLDFEHGAALGSVIQTEVTDECKAFILSALAALRLRNSAFHLEFFDTGREFVFLEIGARVPGADVPYVLHDVHGVNLFRLWIDVMLGREISPIAIDPEASGGWLMIPRPKPLPQQVVDATPMMGKIPFLYRELIPKPGQILQQAGGYATLQGGRFLFRGGDQREIEDAIEATLAAYRITTTPYAMV